MTFTCDFPKMGRVMKAFFVLMNPFTGMMLKKQMGKLKELVEASALRA